MRPDRAARRAASTGRTSGARRASVAQLGIERFQYTPVGDQLALVRLLAGLEDRLAPPSGADLMVRRGPEWTLHPARACRLGDPAGPRRRRGGGSNLLWRASFAVALEIVEYPHAVFELTAPGGAVLALPAPDRLADAVPDLAELRSGLIPPSQLLRRLAVVATVCTVTSASTPAISLAASGGSHGARNAAPIHKALERATHRAVRPRPVPKAGSSTNAAVPAPKATHVAHPAHGDHAKATARHAKATAPHAETAAPQAERPGQQAHPAAPETNATTPGHAKPEAPAPPRPTSKRVEPPSHHAAKQHPHVHERTPSRPQSDGLSAPSQLSPTPPDTSALGGSQAGIPTNPAVAAELSRLSTLLADGDQPPSFLIPIYKAAAHRYHVPWKILAAINAIETNYGRNMNTSSAGAIGWMQFMPATWRTYGVSTNAKRRPDPYDPADAIFSAARYLAANGAPRDLRKAIFAYNHAQWYVDEVLWKAQVIKGGPGLPVTGSARTKVAAMVAMADLLVGKPYVWGGGHGGWDIAAGYDCSGFVSAVLHAGGYLTAPQTTETLPSQPGIQPGPGHYVTIFDRAGAGREGHVIVDLNGKFYESGGSAASGGGAGVKRLPNPPADYLASFNVLLHPAGL